MHAPLPGIEIQSHHPEVYYRMGASQAAYEEVLSLSDEDRERRAYPEVSFALVGAVATGVMGIEPGQGEAALRTLPQLPDRSAWAQLSGIAVGGALVDVRHEGNNRSILTNRSLTSIQWTAAYHGEFDRLSVDGAPMPTGQGADEGGRPTSFVTLEVPPGTSATVAVPAGSAAIEVPPGTSGTVAVPAN
jgi:hypothetical protein